MKYISYWQGIGVCTDEEESLSTTKEEGRKEIAQ